MEIRQQYLQHYLHDIAIDQLTDDYQAKGYQVSKAEQVGNARADLVARKGEEVIVIEVKAGNFTSKHRKQVAELGDYVRNHSNYKFLVVLAVPPKPKKIAIPNLKQLLSDYLVDTHPKALDTLPAYARITDVTDVIINELTVSEEGIIAVRGSGIVDITIGYDPSDEDGVLANDISPFVFEAKLNYNDNRELYLDEMAVLEIDVSSFE